MDYLKNISNYSKCDRKAAIVLHKFQKQRGMSKLIANKMLSR